MQFSHTYQELPDAFYKSTLPTYVNDPQLIIFNEALSQSLQLNLTMVQPLAEYLSGNKIPQSASPIALAYAGHQFGYLNDLGDGRAHLLGELETPIGRIDIQLKGSGRTPFSRNGDGKATLASMLREYIVSEAMHTLGIPTTRSLAVVETGETIIRMQPQQGAILTRMASSHLRVGTFVYASSLSQKSGTLEPLKALLDYTITRHYPELATAENKALALLERVIEMQAELVVNWCRVGFIHGVMNTDNITISGETIDYGPCAFMDAYDEATVFSSIDSHGRYSFADQAPVMHWNMKKLAESLLPLIDNDGDKSIDLATKTLDRFQHIYEQKWTTTLCAKLGLSNKNIEIAEDLLTLMQSNKLDYTNTFIVLTNIAMGRKQNTELDKNLTDWQRRWNECLDDNSVALMQANNPVIIPRNHNIEYALSEAEKGDLSAFHALLDAVKTPYDWESCEHLGNNEILTKYQQPPSAEWTRNYQTFCGT